MTYLSSNQSDEQFLQRICDELLSILKNNIQNDRLVVPFLKMVSHLLLSGISFPEQENDFHNQLLKLVWESSCKSKDPQKLIVAVDLFCNLLQFSETCRKYSLNKLVIFLCHRMPRVRKVTANKLYEAFIMYDVLPEDVADEVSDILTETDWNKAIDELRPIRNSMCRRMGLEPPKIREK